MPLRKSKAASNPAPRGPSAPPPAASPAQPGRRRRPWLALVAVAVLAGVGWGAWSLWRPDPLREAREAMDRRDFDRASKLLTARLAGHPDDPPTLLLAARAARRGKSYSAAAEYLRKYRERAGADDASEREWSLLRAENGDVAEADRLFAKYVEQPDSPDAPLAMEAYLLCKLKTLAPGAAEYKAPRPRPPEVIADLRRAVDLWLRHRPGRADQAQGRVWAARVSLLAGDHPAAVAALREALELDPESFDAHFHLALALGQSQPDEAAKHLEFLLAKHPDDPFIRYGLATTYRMLGRNADARRLLEGLRSGPTELSALVELAQLDMDEGKVAAAGPMLERVLKQAPNSPEANIAMSRFLQLSGRPAEAEKYRKRFEELDAERNKKAGVIP